MSSPSTEQITYSEEVSVLSALEEDTRIESLRLALMAWFGRHPDMHCFLAVDPSQRDLTSGDSDEMEPFASLPRADFIIDHEAFPEARRPYLLQLDLSTKAGAEALAHSARIAFEDRRPECMAEGLGQRVGGWLASSVALDEVVAHWSRLALQHDDDGRACVLRFYDSRALALLWTVLSQAQQQAVLGPVSALHVLDACAKPTVHLTSSESRTHFILSPEQWPEIHRHGLVNRALALHAQVTGRQPEPGEIEAAVVAAARAERHGLIERDDQLAFIGHALAWHPHFDLHPKVLQLLERRVSDDLYTSEIGRLSADEIEEIRRGSWHESLDPR